MQGQIALLLRTMVLYPLAGFLAASLSNIMTWDAATGQLVLDVNATSVALAALIWVGLSTGTFAWSRVAKSFGWAT